MDDNVIKQLKIFFGIIALICIFISIWAYIQVSNIHKELLPYYQHFTCDSTTCRIVTLNGFKKSVSETLC